MILPLILTENNRNNLDIVAKGKSLPSIKEFFLMLSTFSLTVFAWIFFRAKDMSHAFSYISGIFSSSLFSLPKFGEMGKAITCIIFLVFFMVIEWMGREQQYAFAKFGSNWPKTVRWTLYFAIIYIMIVFGGSQQEFIYFQF